jgi:hypothetical protein
LHCLPAQTIAFITFIFAKKKKKGISCCVEDQHTLRLLQCGDKRKEAQRGGQLVTWGSMGVEVLKDEEGTQVSYK